MANGDPKPNDSTPSLPTFDAAEEERAYWRSKTPQERLAAAELMRQRDYPDYDPSDPIERVLEITTRETGDPEWNHDTES